MTDVVAPYPELLSVQFSTNAANFMLYHEVNNSFCFLNLAAALL